MTTDEYIAEINRFRTYCEAYWDLIPVERAVVRYQGDVANIAFISDDDMLATLKSLKARSWSYYINGERIGGTLALDAYRRDHTLASASKVKLPPSTIEFDPFEHAWHRQWQRVYRAYYKLNGKLYAPYPD